MHTGHRIQWKRIQVQMPLALSISLSLNRLLSGEFILSANAANSQRIVKEIPFRNHLQSFDLVANCQRFFANQPAKCAEERETRVRRKDEIYCASVGFISFPLLLPLHCKLTFALVTLIESSSHLSRSRCGGCSRDKCIGRRRTPEDYDTGRQQPVVVVDYSEKWIE